MFPFLDLSDIQGLIFFAVRIVLGIVAGVVAWLAGGPLVRLLWRLAFQRPAPRTSVTVGRLTLGVLLGVLTFLYFPIGGGGLGWGWGPGSGGGPGAGPGPGGSALGGNGQKGQTRKITSTARKGETTPEPGTLTIELVPSKRYQPGSYRYYLIERREPARTLDEVEAALKKDKGRWRLMRIIIPPNSAYADHPAVAALKELANHYGLPHVEPQQPDGATTISNKGG
jgi:hypothetical protein